MAETALPSPFTATPHGLPAPTTLAQLGGRPVNVQPLPDPPALSHYLLEAPVLPAIALALAGAIVFVSMNRAGNARRGLLIGGALLAAALALIAVATLVVTPRERMTQRTDELVDAIAGVRLDEVEAMLAPEAFASVPQAGFDRIERDEILRRNTEELGRSYRVESYRLSERGSTLDGPTVGRTQFRVVASGQGYASVPSWWRLTWRLDPSGQWLVTRVECLSFGL